MAAWRDGSSNRHYSAMQSVDDFLPLAQVLASNGALSTLKALNTVSSNLAARPLDERVRTLRTGNEAVQRNLLEWPVATQFLKLLGFVEVEGFLSVVGTDVQRSARCAVEALKMVRSECSFPARDESSGSMRRSSRMSSGGGDEQVSNSTYSSSGRGREAQSPSVLCQRLRRPPPGSQRLEEPLTTWSEVSGLGDVKRQLHSASFSSSSPPLGEAVLLYGPPRSGKTFVAHAAAATWGLRVMTFWGTELHSPFARKGAFPSSLSKVGESNGAREEQGRQSGASVGSSGTAGCSRGGDNFPLLFHHMAHVAEVAPVVLLLRGADPILAAVTSAIRSGFPDIARRIVIVATCAATDELVKVPVAQHHASLSGIRSLRQKHSQDSHETQRQRDIDASDNENVHVDAYSSSSLRPPPPAAAPTFTIPRSRALRRGAPNSDNNATFQKDEGGQFHRRGGSTYRENREAWPLSCGTALVMDELACYDKLVHVPDTRPGSGASKTSEETSSIKVNEKGDKHRAFCRVRSSEQNSEDNGLKSFCDRNRHCASTP